MNVPIIDPIVSQQSRLPMAPAPTEPNGSLPEHPGEEVEAEDIQYNPIPPRRVITVTVRYELQGRGLPLPYELDEDASE